MTEYYFDKDARLQAWIEENDPEKASDLLCDALVEIEQKYGIKITIDGYSPDKEKELYNETT